MTESFGPFVSEWIASPSPGKQARLSNLCALLGADRENVGGLRYQLFHRTAAAILEARRYRASKAIMIVQSFCPDATGLSDFIAFSTALGFSDVGIDVLRGPIRRGGMDLWMGWAADKAWNDCVDSSGVGNNS